jgi:DNA-directed RNA polymerase subunit RPC12/RpoP
MQPKVFITIASNGRDSTYPYRMQLKQMGFSFNRTGKYSGVWNKKTDSEFEIQLSKKFAKERNLACLVEYPEDRRSADYRRIFFHNNPGLFKSGEYYQCAYCGLVFSKDRITVDHLFSVRGTQKSPFYKKLLQKIGITNINDPKNLVPACQHCNSKKGSKGGIWIIRGLVGKSFVVWAIRWMIRFALFVLCIAFLIAKLQGHY